MNKGTIKVGGQVACWVTKRGSYEVSFPPEETLKSFHFSTILEVHQWLDGWYGVGEWTVE